MLFLSRPRCAESPPLRKTGVGEKTAGLSSRDSAVAVPCLGAPEFTTAVDSREPFVLGSVPAPERCGQTAAGFKALQARQVRCTQSCPLHATTFPPT